MRIQDMKKAQILISKSLISSSIFRLAVLQAEAFMFSCTGRLFLKSSKGLTGEITK